MLIKLNCIVLLLGAYTKPTYKSSVSDPYHFDAYPDPRIRFRDDGSGSGSGSGSDLKSNKFQFFLLNFFCIRFKTHNDVFFVVILSLYSRILNKISDLFFFLNKFLLFWLIVCEFFTIFFGTRIQINVS